MNQPGRKNVRFIVILICWVTWTTGFGQAWDALPQLIPSYRNDFFREDLSYSGSCFDNLVIDDSGRMWLNACGLQRVINDLGVFSFDGYEFQPLEIKKSDGVAIIPNVKGITSAGKFYGQADGKAFLMDPLHPTPELLPFADTAFNASVLRGIHEVNGILYVIATLDKATFSLFTLQNGQLVQQHAIDYSEGFWTASIHNISGNEEELWLAGGSLPFFRLNLASNRVDTFTIDNFTEEVPASSLTRNNIYSHSPRIVVGPNNQVYLLLPHYYSSQLYRFDRKLQQFAVLNTSLPDGWIPLSIFKDQVGNICFLFEDSNQKYKAIIEDSSGQRFDASKLLSDYAGIANIVAENFKRHLYIVGVDGLHSVSVQESGAIEQGMEGKWISSMIHVSDRKLLVNTVLEGWFTYDLQSKSAQAFSGTDCETEPPVFEKGMKQQIIPDEQGNLWFVSHKHLVKYNPQENTCSTIELEDNGQLFALVHQDLAIVQYTRTQICLVDIKRGETVPLEGWIPNDLGSFLRDILVDAKGNVWIPTNQGLWKLDFEQRQATHIKDQAGFKDFRFTAIYEDPKGRLWLGTYFGGLHIYDPQTELVQVINQENGLSNNSVMSIIADAQGDVWVGTEYGITVLSSTGEVLNTLFQEDGLNMDRFERFDPYLGPTGKLFFGTRAGINIIDPRQLKANLKNGLGRKIYLTEAVYFDQKAGKEIVHRDHLDQVSTINIPAENPGILLRFALSSYLEPQKNRYAYQLEGKDEAWTYLGAQPELRLSSLPPGKYNIFIKGADFRNNWTTEPLVIPIHARQFFYKQAWFYLLVSIPFLAFAGLWIQNKRREAQRLEIKVAVQTQKIREDKELIEQQATDLRELDQLKSNFFTNISHELRTPITLIKAPLEHILERYGAQLGKGLRASLQLVLNNANKLSRQVEELLELSRLDAKKIELRESATPIHSFCEQLFYAYSAAAALKNISYQFTSEIDPMQTFLIDRNRLEKIINNLLSNALKFTPAGGTIRMSLGQKEESLLLEVEDSGRGIPEEDLPHLFERYFQTRRSDMITAEGTGIGLALSRELVELMGGEITVESEWGKGSTFRVRLPAKKGRTSFLKENVAPVPDTIAAADQQVVFAKAETEEVSQRSKIMVVEDNPEMQQLIQTILSPQYECLLCNHGAEAWGLLKKNAAEVADIDLILSDVMMPEMDGYTLLEKIKGHPRWQGLPVVMLTARSAEDDKLQALRMGVDDYLMKPFSPQELKARLRNLIHNYQSRKPYQQDKPQEVNITFEKQTSADQLWLKEVENAAKTALQKGLKLTTTILAEDVFLSNRQFARRLKALTGLSPKAYIQEVKLQKARSLLENGVYKTVEEVAAATGYSSGSYLTKSFQERFGKKPAAYL